MFLFFELFIYAGLLLIAVGGIWSLAVVMRGKWQKLTVPAALLVLGIGLFAFPIVYTRTVVDLGPHEQMVGTERHLTLTGWDRDDYSILLAKTDTVVLQVANADVTDRTVEDYIQHLDQLQELDLNDSQVTDETLPMLAKLTKLATLKLRGTRITDAGFREHLMDHPNLLQLDLRNTSVAPETIDQWQQQVSNRRVLQ